MLTRDDIVNKKEKSPLEKHQKQMKTKTAVVLVNVGLETRLIELLNVTVIGTKYRKK